QPAPPGWARLVEGVGYNVDAPRSAVNHPLELALILHLELPAGSEAQACATAWARCFQPLLGALSAAPDARVGLVLAGDLVADLEANHADAIVAIRDLVERGHVELLATALYEPVLSAIPERDAIGQFAVHAA